MPSPLRFEIQKRSNEHRGRTGVVTTLHGRFETPAFMPVATAAAMKGLTPEQVRSTGAEIILNNAFHLLLRPGLDVLRAAGGSHRFMRWNGPMLTDSGGFQAWSMSDITNVDDEGATIRSFVDGSRVALTPELSMEVQNAIGADIVMAFDDCPPSVRDEAIERPKRLPRTASIIASSATSATQGTDDPPRPQRKALSPEAHARRLREAHERTIRWLSRCVKAHARPDEQALFGIVQGGTDLELRRESAMATCALGLAGYAIGGVAVGEAPDEIRRVVEFTAGLLPEASPRYLMGVGYERDIVAAVAAGIDMFDCVLPTRNGRNALAFTRDGPIRLRNAQFRLDPAPIDSRCDCATCADGFSRSYLRHLFLADEMLGPTLVSLHNLRHFQRLLLDIRHAIRNDAWSSLVRDWPVLAADDRGPRLDPTSPPEAMSP